MSEPKIIICDNLDKTIERYQTELGYRLDMIVPADSPTAAIVSKEGEKVRLEAKVRSSGFSRPKRSGEPTKVGSPNDEVGTPNDEVGTQRSEWVSGRAGMEYRDLIPGRLGGKVIASHIRLVNGGEVHDYVHYHKVAFQMIYCKRGRIKVVYEDQGPPFWLETGDCVLQPPEIRHRVLKCTAGAEVIEIGMPDVHETWVEHKILLPTLSLSPERDFNGQRFVRHIAEQAEWMREGEGNYEYRDTGIREATKGIASVQITRSDEGNLIIADSGIKPKKMTFLFVLSGEIELSQTKSVFKTLKSDDSFIIPPQAECLIRVIDNCEFLEITL